MNDLSAVRRFLSFVVVFLVLNTVQIEVGRIVADGPPAELIRAEGHYAALHDAWLRSLA